MRRRPLPHDLSRAAQALCACALLCAVAAGAGQARVPLAQSGRVVAFADVHGAYEELTRLLRSVGVVDAELRWSAGPAQVVSLGDLLDRGAGSRQTMDLLMRLQREAAAAGGALHVVLGNHEAMNLLGDLRDTTAAEFAAYADLEPKGLRERLRGEWIAQRGKESIGAFDGRFPPGYFGQRAALAADGKYGRWLLGLPVAIVVGDTLFMHAGPSRIVSGLSLEQVNRRYRAALGEYLAALDAVVSRGLVAIDDPFADRAALASRRLASAPGEKPDESLPRAEAVRRFAAADRDPMLDVDGPNWYRGAALCNEVSETDVLEPVLDGLGVKRLVIGHTVAHDQRASSRFDGKVIKLDTGMNRAVYHGHPAALLLERGSARVVYADEGGQPAPVPAEPLYVSSSIPDEAVASTLAAGEVTVGEKRAPGTLDVVVEREGRRIPAVFVEGDAAAKKELAAYRIDRALRLGLVPATVRRDVQGKPGVLQARPARWVSQAEVQAKSLVADGWCALPPQFELMYAFDALIGNEGRTPDRVLYDASQWIVLLTGHDRAFGAGKSFPPYLMARPPQPGPEMRRRLSTLDQASLARIVGDLLGDRERTALLARRDLLLGPKASSR